MYTFFRIIKFAFQKFWRNLWLSIVTIIVLILALLSINFIIILNYIANTSIESIKNKIDITVYFSKDASETEIMNLKNFLQSLSEVSSVQYISPQDALDNFKKRYSNSKEILNSLDELDKNPLSASLIIKADSIKDYETILNILSDDVYKNLISTTSFDNYKVLIDKIHNIVLRVKQFGYFLSLIFVLMSALIIYNTVKVNVYTHRQEITIMKLVGASNILVRAPFILESMIVGFIAVMGVILILYPIINFIQPYFINFLGSDFNLVAYFYDNAVWIFGFQLLGVWFLNILSSGFAVGRYLKV